MSESVSDKHSQWSDSGPIIKRPRYALSECLKSCCSVKDIDINLIVNSISSNAFLMVTIVKLAKAHFLKHVRISFRTASHDDRARTVSNLKFIWVTIYAYSLFKIISFAGKMLSQQQSRANIRVNTLTHNTNIAKGTTDPGVEFISQDHSAQFTKLEHITISETRLSINFKISTKHQHLD